MGKINTITKDYMSNPNLITREVQNFCRDLRRMIS